MPALWNPLPTELDPMTATISAALIGLWGTCLLGLLVPGPNFAAIGAI